MLRKLLALGFLACSCSVFAQVGAGFVATKYGAVDFRELKSGTFIYAYDRTDRINVESQILFMDEIPQIKEGVYIATDELSVLVEKNTLVYYNKGFGRAYSIQEGDMLLTLEGREIPVSFVQFIPQSELYVLETVQGTFYLNGILIKN